MAGASDTIEVIFKGNDKVSGVANGITKSFGAMGKGIATGAKIGAAAIASLSVGTIALGGKLVDMGSDAAETSSLIQASLGPATEGYTKRLKDFASQANRSFFELQQGSSTIIAMTKSMGASQTQAADFGVTFAQMSSDLGSFFNQSDSQVLLDIQSALSGSSEPMQKYGIDVKEGTLKQMALNQGLIETAGETLPALVRAQLVQQAIMEQGKDAMGDAIRTSDGWANSLRGLKATVTDAATEAGSKLLPVLQPLLSRIGQLGDIIVPKLSAAFEGLLPNIELIANGVSQFLTLLVSSENRVNDFGSVIVNLAMGFGLSSEKATILHDWFYKLVEGAQSLSTKVSSFLTPAFETMKRVMAELITDVGLVKNILTGAQDPVNGVAEIVARLAWAFGLTGDANTELVEKLRAGLTAVRNFITPIVDWIKKNIDLKDVLGALAIFIGVNLVTAIGSAVIAFAPFIAIGIALIGVVKLVRDNWDSILPILISVKEATTKMIDAFKSGESPLTAITDYVKDLALSFGVGEEQAENVRLTLIKVWDQVIVVKDAIVAFMEPIIEWIKNNVTLQDVMIGLAVVLGGVVLAAIVAIAQAIGPVILVVVGAIAAVTLLRKAWEGLQPIMEKVKNFFTQKVFPAFKLLRDIYVLPLTLAFKGLKIMAQSVLDVVEKLTLGLIDINIPDVLTPGSPTPFENGLKGIRTQMQGMYSKDLPALNSNLQGIQTTNNRTQNVNQTTNIYTSRVDSRGETSSANRFALGGI